MKAFVKTRRGKELVVEIQGYRENDVADIVDNSLLLEFVPIGGANEYFPAFISYSLKFSLVANAPLEYFELVETSFRVVVTSEGTTIFQGFTTPYIAEEPIKYAPYPFFVECLSDLNFWKNETFPDTCLDVESILLGGTAFPHPQAEALLVEGWGAHTRFFDNKEQLAEAIANSLFATFLQGTTEPLLYFHQPLAVNSLTAQAYEGAMLRFEPPASVITLNYEQSDIRLLAFDTWSISSVFSGGIEERPPQVGANTNGVRTSCRFRQQGGGEITLKVNPKDYLTQLEVYDEDGFNSPFVFEVATVLRANIYIKASYANSPDPDEVFYYNFDTEEWQSGTDEKFFSPRTESLSIDADIKEFDELRTVIFEVGFTTTPAPNGDGSINYFISNDPDTGDPLPEPLLVATLFAFANVEISLASKTGASTATQEVATNPYSQPLELTPAFVFGQVSTNPPLNRLNFVVPVSIGNDEQLIREYLFARALEQYSSMSVVMETTFIIDAVEITQNPYKQINYDYGRGTRPFRLVRGIYDLYTEQLKGDFIEIPQPPIE
jgi:hypothetical protein